MTLQHPDTDRWTRVDILGDESVSFRANPRGLPEVRVPIAQSPEWARQWDGAVMRVYEDGSPAPIDELDRVEVEQQRTILIGTGGVELRQIVPTDIQIERTHEAAERLIQDNTSYTANVDAPDVTVDENVEVQAPSTQADFSTLTDVTDDLPIEIPNSDYFGQLQVAFTTEGEDVDDGRQLEVKDPPNLSDFSNGDAWYLSRDSAATNGPDFAEYNFTLDYTIPSDAFSVAYRWQADRDNGAPAFIIELQHDNGDTYTIGENVTDGFGNDFINWFNDDIFREYSGPDLEPGDYTVRFEVTDSDAQGDKFYAYLDAVAPYDNRYKSVLDFSTTLTNGRLNGPQHYPEIEIEFADYVDPFFVTGGDITVDTVNGTTLAEVALSNDRGQTYPISTSGTNILTGDFADDGATLRFRATLEGQGTRDTDTPRLGYEPQQIDSYELSADLDRTPGLIDYSEERRLGDILEDIAGDEYLWEVDRKNDGSTSIEWAEPEQRVSDDTVELTDLTVEKETERVTSVTVKGANARISETFVADTAYVDLDRQDIVPQTETVSPTNGDKTFDRGDDYEMKFRSGEIKINTKSDMTAGETYSIDYQSEIRSTATVSPNDGTAEVVEIPSAATGRAAGQIARFLVDEFSVPRWRATARIPPQTGVFSAIDAINVGLADELPDEAFPLSPREVQSTPEGLVTQLGRSRDFASAVSSISSTLRDVSRRV